MKKKLAIFLVVILACISCLPAGNTFAGTVSSDSNAGSTAERVEKFSLYYTEITLADNMVLLTSKTSDTSEEWDKLGIVNIETVKSDFERRDIVAAIGNTDTKEIVYFTGKLQSDETLKVFDTLKYSDDELKEYALSQINIEGVKAEADVFNHPQGKFFKISLESEDADEVIIGAIFNGQLVEFSMDTGIYGAGIDEAFLEEVVNRAHFTKIMTREEYDEAVSRTWRNIFIFLGALVLFFIVLVVISLRRKKNAKRKSEEIAQKMAAFRDKKKSGKLELGEALYTVDTVYDKKLIEAFIKYDTWIKNLKSIIPGALVYAAIIWFMKSNGGTVVMIFTIAVGIVVLYMMYSAGEKKKDSLCRQFVVKEKKVATFRFYEECFTMSGLSSMTEFIYQQVTNVKVSNDYIFLYMSDEYAVFVDLEGMELETAGSLIHMLKEKTK